MVELKIRTGKVGVVKRKIDAKVKGDIMDVIATIIELETAVFEFITSIEKETGLNLHEATIENLAHRFNELDEND